MANDIKLGPLSAISEPFRADEATLIADGSCRRLSPSEIAELSANGVFAEDWNGILVSDSFDPSLVRNCEFYGRVTIGDLEPGFIEYHDLRLPVGIRDSTIVSCRIGSGVAIRDVHYLARYAIGDRCLLFNVDEMLCTDHAKFGNGVLKEGESEDVRIWLEAGNENGGRKILPFEGLLASDAFIWSKYRGDAKLMERLKAITDAGFSPRRGSYGEIGERSVIKDCRIIKDVKVGPHAYIKGASKLKNITVLSSAAEGTQIGEGVELVNGIVGHGNRIFYGAKAVRFVTGRNVQLKYGARLLNSVLGDNSTVSCCELLNNLIFPFHEQHHNNSFLIASTVMGQSNIAAGATIGSNHNSRSPDGEISAGRGFWPGLCTDFKHNSRFASFCLVAKGSYAHELDIAYPFSMVYLQAEDEAVRVMPAYWFLHNMYAMERNLWKFKKRDLRVSKVQHIELDYLAPDTVQEILAAMERLDSLAAAAGRPPLFPIPEKDLPLDDPALMRRHGGRVEKPARARASYRAFCLYFGVKTLVDFLKADAGTGLAAFLDGVKALSAEPLAELWVNAGGQVMAAQDLESLKADVKSGKIFAWAGVHARYDEIFSAYPGRRARYALGVIERLLGRESSAIGEDGWKALLKEIAGVSRGIFESALASRRKDFEEPFRKITFENDEEMLAVLGEMEKDPFLADLNARTSAFMEILAALCR